MLSVMFNFTYGSAVGHMPDVAVGESIFAKGSVGNCKVLEYTVIGRFKAPFLRCFAHWPTQLQAVGRLMAIGP